MTAFPSVPPAPCASPMTPEAEADARFQPFAIQVLSLLLYGGFAIVATILAFVHFWPAGVVLALFLAWRGFGPTSPGRSDVEQALRTVIPQADRPRSSGNASFDAYRGDMLNRLEEEQKSFEGFLTRLRAAKDQREFDTYMDDRARRDGPPDVWPDDRPDDRPDTAPDTAPAER